jgi:sugar phosphate isomerase/epimerase
MGLKIGLIGIVGEEMKNDPWGTLERVAQIGYQGVEGTAGLASRTGLTVDELQMRLAGLGLKSVAQGLRLHQGETSPAESIATARSLASKYIVQYWGPCESVDQLKRQAELFDHVGAECREAGITFCYHNHNHEFAQFDGKTGLDILMENCDPRNVAVELDVAWVTYGGVDPVATIRKYAGRCPILHMKDLAVVPEGGYTGNEEREGTQFTEVGTGVVNTQGVVEAARECGVKWLVVEQDRMRDLAPMDSIRVSYENLKRIVG